MVKPLFSRPRLLGMVALAVLALCLLIAVAPGHKPFRPTRPSPSPKDHRARTPSTRHRDSSLPALAGTCTTRRHSPGVNESEQQR